MRVMILCHGRNHSFGNKPWDDLCGTSALTRRILYKTPYRTLDIDRSSRPHIIHDITKPIRVHGKFDIITAMHAPWFIYFNWKTCDIISTTFTNMQGMLKNGGYIVLAIADEGIYGFMRKYKLLSRRVRKTFYRYMRYGVPCRAGQYIFIRKYVSKFISNYISYCFSDLRCIGEQEKNCLLQRWNKTARDLHDDHQLIIMQYVPLQRI